MKKSFSVALSLILVLSCFSVFSFATEVKEKSTSEEGYLAPYIDMFKQYVNETGLDAEIFDLDLFYKTCKDLSLSEWKIELDKMFAGFKLASENTEPFIVGKESSKFLNDLKNDDFDDGAPGESVFSDENLRYFNFSDSFQGYYNSIYRYRMDVSGLIVYESGINKVFSIVNWQSWTYSGQNYYHVTSFTNTVNYGSYATTTANGHLVTSSGVILTVLISMPYTIYPTWYNG